MAGRAVATEKEPCEGGASVVIDGPAPPEQPNGMTRDAELQVDDSRHQADARR